MAKIQTPDTYSWEGTDVKGRAIHGEETGHSESHIQLILKKQGVKVTKLKKLKKKRPTKVGPEEVSVFARQLATMMRAGVALTQGLDIVAKGNTHSGMKLMVFQIKAYIEEGNSLGDALEKHPDQFDALFVSLIKAGEKAGILEDILERVATYKEKVLAIKGKIKSAMFYPTAVLVLAFLITAAIMIFVVPAFKELFDSFGGGLPLPTQIIVNMSNFFTAYWWLIFGGIGGAITGIKYSIKKSVPLQEKIQRLSLKAPLFGELLHKAAVARWTRTLATMMAAGVPLIEALDSVASASGNIVYETATKDIQERVATGISLTSAIQQTHLFPAMMIQMASIGEESGSLDSMLNKVADKYDREVDDTVAALSSLMEPLIMAVIGTLIGGLVVAMYLPIFKMGGVMGS
jgi:type IV pilus assembly protein PilC